MANIIAYYDTATITTVKSFNRSLEDLPCLETRLEVNGSGKHFSLLRYSNS